MCTAGTSSLHTYAEIVNYIQTRTCILDQLGGGERRLPFPTVFFLSQSLPKALEMGPNCRRDKTYCTGSCPLHSKHKTSPPSCHCQTTGNKPGSFPTPSPPSASSQPLPPGQELAIQEASRATATARCLVLTGSAGGGIEAA